ncbi:MAG: glycosyl transferase [Hungatella sp.]|jgi:hypothetical protein|nr:glycosyl transferase [Hungatella sp.]
MPIPKKIHYCWFGKGELPEKVKKCIESWKKNCPDYEIIEWNELNYDVNKIQYTKQAYDNKKWAFVSDYARLDIIFCYGGFYLDTDVELIKSLDDLRQNDLFFALEQDCNINSGLGFGAIENHKVIKNLRDLYLKLLFINLDGSLNLKPCTSYTTDWFVERGYVKKDKMQIVAGAVILPSGYFCPMEYKTGKMIITKDTHGIHWYDGSWTSIDDRKIREKELQIQKKVLPLIANPVCGLYRNIYRLRQYTREGTIIKNIKRKIKFK